MRGAGGTTGGTGQFVIGLIMMVAGGYLFLRSISVHSHFGLGFGIFSFGNTDITTGMVLIPFIFGVGFIFYNSKNLLGWVLAGASLVMIVFGVIASMRITFRGMSAFDVLVILVLLFGGIGLFLRSLKTQ